jgi:hypothetical protein
VKATGIEVQYCANDNDLASARIRVALLFENRQQQNLILLREFPSATSVSVVNTLGKEVLQLDLGHDMFVAGDLVKIGEVPDGQIFQILKPGESTKRIVSIQLFVSKDTAHHLPGTVLPGTYILLARVPTQPPFAGNDAQIKLMLARWKKHGMVLIPQVEIKTPETEIVLPHELPSCSSDVSGLLIR